MKPKIYRSANGWWWLKASGHGLEAYPFKTWNEAIEYCRRLYVDQHYVWLRKRR